MPDLATLVATAVGKPCVGCGSRSESVAVWQPTEPQWRRDFGMVDGRPRPAVFPLCSTCNRRAQKSPAARQRIDAAVVATLRREGWLDANPGPGRARSPWLEDPEPFHPA
jgi:hypothetical protein